MVTSSSSTTRLRLEFKEDMEEESGLVEETVVENCNQRTPLLARDVHLDETCRCLGRFMQFLELLLGGGGPNKRPQNYIVRTVKFSKKISNSVFLSIFFVRVFL